MKKFAPNLLDATHEALVKSYWYKNNLRSFLHRAGVPASVLAEYDWSSTGPAKYHTARAIIDRYAADPATGTPLLQSIVDGLVEQDDFPQLKNLEDGPRKVKEAKAAVKFLRDLLGLKTVTERAERARADKRDEAARASEQASRRKEAIKTLANRFLTLSSQTDHNQRGRDFEPLLRDLFVLYDLDPRSSFSSPGEQTDGSLVIDGTYVLVEAKWTSGPIHPDQIRNFRAKIEDKLDSTLGLFISMSGFTAEAVHRAAQGRRLLILMDGVELAYIFQGLWALDDLLRRKLREAAETGNVFFKPW
ncbi:restriction endonuclease [Sorangium sp. So ce185]|uniref:restriction endonuclease n=1 Tax=Sorangium sp. So ce185 TaxID=3133287 RepID=UPI003F63398D